MKKYKTVVLIILDGWGLSPSWGGNALVMNNPKTIDTLWRTYPHTILQALGSIQYGNVVGESRLGHLMIGAGRKVSGFHAQIGQQIKNRRFFKNEVLISAFNHAKKNNSSVHLMGMISDGGVHADVSHLLSLLDMAHQEGFNRVYIDAITDGVDTGATDALIFIERIQNKINSLKIGIFSSVGGRDFAMDRDEHWDKIQKYYSTITEGRSRVYNNIHEAITLNYRENKTDDFISPGLIKDGQGRTTPIKANDAVIFFNFREDRAKQLTKTFVDPKFRVFLWRPKKLDNLYFATFIDYQKNLPAKVAFLEKIYPQTLSEVLSQTNFHQLKLAESEKKTHVTSFFNGGREEPFPGEEVKIISSPNIASYDQKPEMSAEQLTKACCEAIFSGKYELIVLNFANVDIIAHTGNIIAVGQAAQILDQQIAKIVEIGLKEDITVIITADHGNAEQMVNINQKISKERETLHTLNPVPFILVAGEKKKDLVKTSISAPQNTLSKIITASDTLADVAPTILELLGLPKPEAMTGHSLLTRLE